MATHLETYRRFDGVVRRVPLRFLPLAAAGIRTACRKKLPLLVLYAFPAIWMVIFSFNVYAKFAMQEGNLMGATPGIKGMLAMSMAAKFIQVREQISEFFTLCRVFALLTTAWFGAGLLAEDRRLGAHLLLFSRPLTRLDYFLGRFLTVFFFGSMVTLVPGLVICATAAFSSPGWSFLTEESEVVWGTLLYGLFTPFFYSMLVLAVSSLASRKAFALAGVFVAVLLPHAIASALTKVKDDVHYRVLSPLSNLGRIGQSLLGIDAQWYRWPVEWSYSILLAVVALAGVAVAVRIRRLEAVG